MWETFFKHMDLYRLWTTILTINIQVLLAGRIFFFLFVVIKYIVFIIIIFKKSLNHSWWWRWLLAWWWRWWWLNLKYIIKEIGRLNRVLVHPKFRLKHLHCMLMKAKWKIISFASLCFLRKNKTQDDVWI